MYVCMYVCISKYSTLYTQRLDYMYRQITCTCIYKTDTTRSAYHYSNPHNTHGDVVLKNHGRNGRLDLSNCDDTFGPLDRLWLRHFYLFENPSCVCGTWFSILSRFPTWNAFVIVAFALWKPRKEQSLMALVSCCPMVLGFSIPAVHWTRQD